MFRVGARPRQLKRYALSLTKVMSDDAEQESLKRAGGDILMFALATAIWSFLSIAKFLPQAEAILIGLTVGFLVGYWLPPRPKFGFVRWTAERTLFIAVFYAIVLKLPPIIAPSANEYLRTGVAFLFFLALCFAWMRHPKSTLGLGRA